MWPGLSGRWALADHGAMSRGDPKEVEDEPVGLVRCFQRNEMPSAGNLDVMSIGQLLRHSPAVY